MKTKNTFPFPTGPKPTMNPYRKAAEARAKIEATARQLTDENRAQLLHKASVLGVGIVHVFDEDDAKGGLTVAFRKVSPYGSGVMVDIAVATCSREDAFSKKTGTKLALEKFFSGQVIELPLASKGMAENLATQVKWAFEALYYTI